MFNDNQFDFDKFHRNIRRGTGVVFFLVICWFLLCATIVAGIAYVAFHFISKFW
jgi:hypothetical protein